MTEASTTPFTDEPGAGALAEAMAKGTMSAVELTDAAIDRIERLDGPINAVVVRDFERARTAAAAADAALARGERRPLLGVPMTVKESFNIAGLPTTWGAPVFKDWIAPRDATAVARLKAAGAVILGKTNVALWLADWQSDNPVYGRTNNPRDPERTAGGSSGGSAAAVASGMVPLELGSDIGGSIRVPASFCGVYGHKPSYGLVPTRGQATPGADGVPPVLAVCGPIARSAADLDLALGVLAGPDEGEATGYRLDLPGRRHGRLADFRVLVIDQHPAAAVADEIRGALADLASKLERAGVHVRRQSALTPDLGVAHAVFTTLLNTALSRGVPAMGEPVSAHQWLDALDAQLRIRRQWAALFHEVDVVLAPAFGVVAFPHDSAPFAQRTHEIDGAATPYGAQVAWPGMALVANLPATAVPIGHTRAGLPIGAQVIGPYLEDRTTIAFAGLIANL